MPDNEHIAKLTAKVQGVLEGEQLGNVMMVAVALLLNTIKQAPQKEREVIMPFMEKFWKTLSREINDAKG
jgi:hypothetical protein